MLSVCKGVLSISSNYLDNIQERINKGDSPKDALCKELTAQGLDFKNISDIQLSGYLMQNPQYLKLYCEIVADCWNKK